MANIKISGIYNTYMSARAEEIKKLNKELAFSRQQLQSALSSAEHASQAKTAFLNNMSHDIRDTNECCLVLLLLHKVILMTKNK